MVNSGLSVTKERPRTSHIIKLTARAVLQPSSSSSQPIIQRNNVLRTLRIVEVDEEEVMQQIMAEALEDERPDDSAIEINTDDEWQ